MNQHKNVNTALEKWIDTLSGSQKNK
jgi:hypothetical protein